MATPMISTTMSDVFSRHSLLDTYEDLFSNEMGSVDVEESL